MEDCQSILVGQMPALEEGSHPCDRGLVCCEAVGCGELDYSVEGTCSRQESDPGRGGVGLGCGLVRVRGCGFASCVVGRGHLMGRDLDLQVGRPPF